MSTAPVLEAPAEVAVARLRAVGSLEDLDLVGVLSSMADTLRELARDFPTWSLPEAQVGRSSGTRRRVLW